MALLRWLTIVAFMALIGATAVRIPWQGRLHHGSTTWLIDLGRAPIWRPPARPIYAEFERKFGRFDLDENPFPPADAAGLAVSRAVKWSFVSVEFFSSLWLLTVASSVLYASVHRRGADLVRSLVTWTAVGLSLAGALCLGLWAAYGGWGPPTPHLFGVFGLAAGLVAGGRAFVRGKMRRSARGAENAGH